MLIFTGGFIPLPCPTYFSASDKVQIMEHQDKNSHQITYKYSFDATGIVVAIVFTGMYMPPF